MRFLGYKQITGRQSQDTGLAMVLVLLGTYVYTKRESLVVAALVVQLLSMTLPQLFRTIAVLWLGLSTILGSVTSRILLSCVYFGVVTPVGVLRRLLGKDSLGVRSFKQSEASVMRTRNHRFIGPDIVRPY